MEFDRYLTLFLPLWWGAAFIAATLLFRLNKRRTEDPGQRIFLYLLIVVAFGFLSAMPVVVLAVAAALMIVLGLQPFIRGKAFVIVVVCLGLAVGGAMSLFFRKFTSDRERSAAVVNAFLLGDRNGWDQRLSSYAALPLQFTSPVPKRDPLSQEPVVGKEKSYFTPELSHPDTVLNDGERLDVFGEKLAVPAAENLSLQTVVADDGKTLFLYFVNARQEAIVVMLYAAGERESVLEKCREAYIDPEAYGRDLAMLDGFFPETRFDVARIGDAGLVQNSQDAILASAQVNITPKREKERDYGFGYDVETYSGALAVGGAGMRIFIIAALKDLKANVEFPLLWVNQFLSQNNG